MRCQGSGFGDLPAGVRLHMQSGAREGEGRRGWGAKTNTNESVAKFDLAGNHPTTCDLIESFLGQHT